MVADGHIYWGVIFYNISEFHWKVFRWAPCVCTKTKDHKDKWALCSPNVPDTIHTHVHTQRRGDGHVGPVATSTNWMPLLTNGLLKPHLQCTIRLSSPLYPPRTVCMCVHTVCVCGRARRTESGAVPRLLFILVSRSPESLCNGHIQLTSTFKLWRHSNVNKWYQWM